jgi:hypothetical protein
MATQDHVPNVKKSSVRDNRVEYVVTAQSGWRRDPSF